MSNIDSKFIINLQGKDFITYEGLLDQAHQKGLKGIETKLIQIPDKENLNTCIVQAIAKLEDGEFYGLGDANPSNVNSFISKHLIRMAECVPDIARILTRDGWKFYWELEIGEDVLAYDLKTNTNKWTKLEDISVYEDIPVYKMETKSFYSVCTHDHKWVVENNGKRQLKELRNMSGADKVVIAATTEGGNSQLTPKEAAVLGWLVTDGSIRTVNVNGKGYPRFTIYQSKQPYVNELKELVQGIGSWSVEEGLVREFEKYTSHCLDAYKFNINAEYGRSLLKKADLNSYDDLIPLVTKLSKKSRKAMLEAMLKADGTRKRSGKGNWEFGTKKGNGKVMEAFEILCTLEGIALGKPRTSTVGDVPIRVLRSYKRTGYQYMDIDELVETRVWCPTTKYGTWVMNIDGNITITGNTRAKARALRDLTNIGMTAFEELGEEEKQGKVDEDKQALEDNSYASDRQLKFMTRLMKEKGFTAESMKNYTKTAYNKEDSKSLTKKEASELIEMLNNIGK